VLASTDEGVMKPVLGTEPRKQKKEATQRKKKGDGLLLKRA